jgi:hypothetical protein
MIAIIKRNIMEFVVGLMLALAVIIPLQIVGLVEDIKKLKAENTSADDYFVVNGLIVADAIQGEEVKVIYDRKVVRPFRGTWTVAVQSLPNASGINYGVCNGSGTTDYQVSTKLPETVNLGWFVTGENGRCVLPPGKYIIRASWEIELDYGVRKFVRQASNVFQIFPPPDPW